jgi:undecaprenyl-diphosphatase
MIFEAIILGIVEGLTEFLPISSTGHLIVAGHLLGFTGPRAESFEIFIQVGAILAVVSLYRHRFSALLDIAPNQTGEFRGKVAAAKLFWGCLPFLVVGAAFGSTVKEHLFSPFSVALALIVGGVIMFVIERRKWEPKITSIEKLPELTCFLIGCFQLMALWPGISRAGATIIGALLLGVGRKAAAEYSFLVAVPVISAAAAYDLLKSWRELEPSDLSMFLVGGVVAYIVAILAIRWFVSFIQQ